MSENTNAETGTVNTLWVYYGDGEYTSHIANGDLAKEYAQKPEYRTNWPLLVQTTEHGGWYMTHYFDDNHPDGICVGTANDSARFSGEQQAVRERLFHMRRNFLPEVRRPARKE